ncbi:hypothetical protein ACFLT7_06485 [candidate division KSB1 bacterium]
MNCHPITIDSLNQAREAFETNEPRDLFYRAATELVENALQGTSLLSLAEALAVLLQTWNRTFYRYRPINNQHFIDIGQLLDQHNEELSSFRELSIESLGGEEEQRIKQIFHDFEIVLGPVGTSKSLHLLAPRYFTLWDRKIATAYGLPLMNTGMNSNLYYCFMICVKQQALEIGGAEVLGRNPVKAIDEYNYCRFSRNWIN